MASEREEGGGFGWGFFVGGLIGFVAGAYLASGPGREHVDTIRSRTIELSGTTDLGGRARAYAERARTAVHDPEHPLGKAVREGVAAAKRKRAEREAANGTPE